MEEKKLLSALKKVSIYLSLALLGTTSLNVFAESSSNEELVQLLENKTNRGLFKKSEETNFYMFVSLVLSDNNLRQILESAKQYKGVVVLRGIKNNSFLETSNHLQRIVGEDEYPGIIIDPTLFTKFEITQVPTYVLAKSSNCPVGISCRPVFDKITGNITPRYALEKFLEKGELKVEAQKLLSEKK